MDYTRVVVVYGHICHWSNYIFLFQPENVVVNNVDFNPEFVSRMIPKLEWGALVQAAKQVQREYSYCSLQYIRAVVRDMDTCIIYKLTLL